MHLITLFALATLSATALAGEVVPVGGACGGGIADPPVCEQNVDCIYATGSLPGAKGVCTLKVSDVGGPCQQVYPNSAVCKQGLVCVKPAPVDPPMAGVQGTCKVPPSETTTAVPTISTTSAPVTTTTAAGSSSTTTGGSISTIKDILTTKSSVVEFGVPVGVVAFAFAFLL
ncbi:hypothetical protein BDR26DRAFT_848762 [Obelidium mucronatum]|nr:hypothetical protein BDR26DRAFT_848762 [Obelidium mucronatum]